MCIQQMLLLVYSCVYTICNICIICTYIATYIHNSVLLSVIYNLRIKHLTNGLVVHRYINGLRYINHLNNPETLQSLYMAHLVILWMSIALYSNRAHHEYLPKGTKVMLQYISHSFNKRVY